MTPDLSYLKPDAKIGIAGAGLLGQLLAWQLSAAGFRVTLFDAASSAKPQSAAHTAAGMLAPISEAAEAGPDVYAMGVYGIERWREWLSHIGTQASSCLHEHGSLLVAHPQDESELEQFISDTRPLQHYADCSIRHLHRDDLQHLEPDLSGQFQRGLLLSPEAHLDNRQLLQQLSAQISTQDVRVYENTPVSAEPFAIISESTGQKFSFDVVIDCRGAGARAALIQLRAVRGETLHLETCEVTLQRPVRLMHPRYQLYIVPKPGNRFVIGATQIESEDLSPISLQSSLELSSAVYTLAPAFAEARILEAGVNLRPAFANNMPSVCAQRGLISANGLYRHGYLLAPAVVDHVLHLLDAQRQSPFAHLLQARRQRSERRDNSFNSEPVYE
ncbi:glycine oxidase ThiO [Gilvimarinus sp. DA14]|uniref:glycine oxidase ThiO n=1 Tax=Gilvimarinus sp. DA14 TaxID=2956798 RepID=UPI0020B6D44F|nr:glycine oxidase ThiO [Gilvimarinus sp. DA14]UTF60856.1 glycine oxidase ThiO [Gilvimarinus sp. DA14]